MRIITETIEIQTTPEQVWNFLTNLDKDNNYKKWHPTDHITYALRKGSMGNIGGEAYFVERIGKFTLRLTYKVTNVNYPTYVEYTAAPPLSWLHAGRGTFKMEAIDSNTTRFIAYVEYGYEVPIIGTVIDWIVERIVKYEDAQKHMHEEGENIKVILESYSKI